MEGTFASASKRKKLVMNNRKANFVLGSSFRHYATTNNSCYVSSSMSPSPRLPTNQLLISHINFGKSKDNNLTENLSKFQTPSPDNYYQKSRYKSETPKNIITGNYPLQFVPSSKDYKTPSFDLAVEQKARPNLTRHNYELGTEKFEKISTTHKEFSPYKPNPASKVCKTGLVSKLKLGGHPGLYISEASASLTVKEQRIQSFRLPDMKKAHFSFGTDQVKFISTQQGFHKELKTKEKAEISHFEYLKKSHFSFDSENPDYITEAKLNSKYLPTKPRVIEKYFKENHISFGDCAQVFKTSYAEAHSPKAGTSLDHALNESLNKSLDKSLDKSLGSSLQDKSLHKSLNKPLKPDAIQGIEFGQDKSPLISTHKLNFKGEKVSPGQLETGIEKSLKSSHFSIGNPEKPRETPFKPGSNETSQKKSILHSEKHEPKSAEVHESHWTFGSHKSTKTSTMRSDFKSGLSEKRIPEDYLKKQSFNISCGYEKQEDFKTSYKSNFKWIQPIPED